MSSRFWLTALLLVGSGCGGFERGDALAEVADDGTTGDSDGVAPSFATTAQPVLARLCSGCHGSGGAAAGTRFRLTGDAAADFGSASALVDTSAPADSRLLTKATGNAHGGGNVVATNSDDYQTLFAWIAGGAAP